MNHVAYTTLDVRSWLNGDRPVVFDANAVLSEPQRLALAELGCPLGSIGRGTA